MAILVTGGAGYIGSHTVLELLNMSEDIVVVDNLQSGHKKAVLGGKLYLRDIRSDSLLDNIFRENDIEAVIHFAADFFFGDTFVDSIKHYNNNVVSTAKLLSKMKDYGVNKIIFSSTAVTYGEPEAIPIIESEKTNPNNPYGETKLAVEKLLKWADETYNIKYVSLRYYNAIGAHRSGIIGEDHNPKRHLIPIIFNTALGKNSLVYIYGDNYSTSDGTLVRDYIHVSDLALAHLSALNKLRSVGKSDIYNVSYGKGFSVKEMLAMAREVTGVNINAVVTHRKPGYPSVLISSPAKIKEELNWTPKYNDMREILDTAWRWHKYNPNGFNDQ